MTTQNTYAITNTTTGETIHVDERSELRALLEANATFALDDFERLSVHEIVDGRRYRVTHDTSGRYENVVAATDYEAMLFAFASWNPKRFDKLSAVLVASNI